jgi:hypothetical protein
MPAPLRITVARPCDKNSCRAIAASRGDFAADSGSDLNTDVAETGTVSGGILMARYRIGPNVEPSTSSHVTSEPFAHAAVLG